MPGYVAFSNTVTLTDSEELGYPYPNARASPGFEIYRPFSTENFHVVPTPSPTSPPPPTLSNPLNLPSSVATHSEETGVSMAALITGVCSPALHTHALDDATYMSQEQQCRGLSPVLAPFNTITITSFLFLVHDSDSKADPSLCFRLKHGKGCLVKPTNTITDYLVW